jgi:hypothetical protein
MIFAFRIQIKCVMGSAGFEPAASSAQGWHHTKLDNDPAIQSNKKQLGRELLQQVLPYESSS